MDEWHIKALEVICGKELASAILDTSREIEGMERTALISRKAGVAGLQGCEYRGSKYAQGILKCTGCGAYL